MRYARSGAALIPADVDYAAIAVGGDDGSLSRGD